MIETSTYFRSESDRGELYARCQVADLEIVTDRTRLLEGRYPSTGVVLPVGIREPTESELERIVAPTEYKGLVMDICRIPRHLGSKAIELSKAPDHKGPSLENPLVQLAEGVEGRFMAVQTAAPNAPTTTVNSATSKHEGLHIDSWSDINTLYLIGDLGLARRFFCFVPDITRQAVGSREPVAVMKHVAARLAEPRRPLAYLVELRAPGDDYFEGCINARVAQILHEGSTIGIPKPSDAFYYMTPPIDVDVFPSVLTSSSG